MAILSPPLDTAYMPRRGTVLIAIALASALARGALSQPSTAVSAPSPRVAVVLGGGTAKGFAHIGALDEIERMGIPIDLVTGTSMGAIIGGLYAAGYSPAALETIVEEEDWSTFFRNPTDRRLQRLYEKQQDQRFTITFPLDRGRPTLPAGAVSRQSIAVHLDRFLWPVHDVTDFMQLPTPFGALVTDLATGDAVLLTKGALAQSIEGSAAVPGIFAPVQLSDGRLVVDGAVNRNLAAEDARRLGADIVICVDVSERVAPVKDLRSLVDVVDQTVSFRVQASNAVQRPLCTVVLEPDVEGIGSTDFAQVSVWIDRGRVAALEHKKELQAIADSVQLIRGAPHLRGALRPSDSVFVRKVLWSKVSDGAQTITAGAISLHDSSWMTQPLIEKTAGRLYGTGRFDQVSYHIVPQGDARDLMFDLTEGDRDQLGIGVRYDTPRGVALLMTARVADIVSPGSTASLSARLGAIQQLDSRVVLGEGLNAPFLQTYRATSTSTKLVTIESRGTTKPVVLDARQIATEVQKGLAGGVVAGVELSHEWSHDGEVGGIGLLSDTTHSLGLMAATLSFDDRATIVAPTQGLAVYARSEMIAALRHATTDYARHTLDAEGALPLFRGVSLVGSGRWGKVTGSKVPLHDWFFLGGGIQSEVWRSQFVSFPGVAPQSLAGRSVRVAQGGVQLTIPSGIAIAGRGAIGNVFEAIDPAVHPGYLRSFGLTVSRMFAPGPVSVSIGTRSWRQNPIVELGMGASF